MATTRIISMHINKGRTVAQCLTDRTAYALNPEKTEHGTLISAYACDPHTADAEFLYAKRQYKAITGREQKNDVIAYQVRQSFRPGEITPEEANRLGYELASRFLKGKHAFLVATHTDRHHIHNHVIWNSTTLDCTRKFRDFLGSGRAVERLSDTICLEHQLSVIQNPRRYTHSTYDKWLGAKAKPSHRALLRADIDAALGKKPESFDAFLKLMLCAGYEIRRGTTITFSRPGQKNIRMRSLGEGYTEEDIRAVIQGTKQHTPRKKRNPIAPMKSSLLLDIQAILDAGKGSAYAGWAVRFNLKQMAKTVLYIQERDFPDLAAFEEKADAATATCSDLSTSIKDAEKRMGEIAVLKTHIINYAKTRDVYAGYRKAGYSKKYLAQHESDILIHRAAKKAFDELGLKKLPTLKSLQAEYARLLSGKKADYAKLRSAREEQKELLIHRENLRQIFEMQDRSVRTKEQEQGRG